MNVDKLWKEIENYKKLLFPKLASDLEHTDVPPLLSFFRVTVNDEKIVRIARNFYLDTETGWIIEYKGFFNKCNKFYLNYLENKRKCKRLLFGLIGTRPILCGIATHVSAKIEDQKRPITKIVLKKAKNIALKYRDKGIINQLLVDRLVFFMMRNPRRFYPRWKLVYKSADKLSRYWRGG